MKKILAVTALISLFSFYTVQASETQTKQTNPTIRVFKQKLATLPWHARVRFTLGQYFRRLFKMQENIQNIIKDGNVLVKFSKNSCPYCVYMAPHYKKLKEEFKDKITFVEVNLNDGWGGKFEQDFIKNFSLQTVPLFLYFKDGKEVKRHGSQDGTMTYDDLKENVKHLCIA